MDKALDREAWQANERELARIAAMPGLDQEMHASEAGRLRAEQDHIQWQLGRERPGDAESRKWSGIE